MKVPLLICLILGFMLSSCQSAEPVIPDMGFDYFPMKVRSFQVYEVEETSILNNIQSSVKYEIKHTITDSSLNQHGIVTYRISRERRNNSAEDWQPFETWTVENKTNRIIQNENNIPFVKLVFPPALNLKWNGNEYNNLPENGNLFNTSGSNKYVITATDYNVTLENGFQAFNTISVAQNQYSDEFIGKDERTEIYAKDIGMIFKQVIQLEYCTNPDCYGQQFVNRGVIYSQSLKSHGVQ